MLQLMSCISFALSVVILLANIDAAPAKSGRRTRTPLLGNGHWMQPFLNELAHVHTDVSVLSLLIPSSIEHVAIGQLLKLLVHAELEAPRKPGHPQLMQAGGVDPGLLVPKLLGDIALESFPPLQLKVHPSTSP